MTKIKKFFVQDVIPVEIKPYAPNGDSWDNLNIEVIAVDTSIAEFTENHDQHPYGTTKQ